MINIPRRSEFSLTDAEKDMIRKQNNATIKNYMEGSKFIEQGITEERVFEFMICKLFYEIGMQDYRMYRETNKYSQKYELKGLVKEILELRAFCSAKLQVLIEDAKLRGYDVNKILHPEIGEIFEYKKHGLDMLYHGTAEKLNPSMIGAPDKDGIYHTRDGISYWTTDYDEAERYSNYINEEQRERGLMGGNIYSRSIEDGTLCATIAETHGGVFAMCQDELIRLNQKGVRYVFPAEQRRTDVLDIGNFADFVKKRDECLAKIMEKFNLRLPKKEESLNEYVSAINDLVNQKKVTSELEEKSDKKSGKTRIEH